MRDAQLKAADLHPLVDKLSAEERLRLATYALRIAHQLKKQREPAEEGVVTPVDSAQRSGAPFSDDQRATPSLASEGERHAGLHQGAITMSDDFDEALPDEFWLGTP